VCAALGAAAHAQAATTTQPPDQRADALLQRMSLQDKLRLALTANGTTAYGVAAPPKALNSAAYLAPDARLGIPAVIETNAGLGVARRYDTGATALPSGSALAASWSLDVARHSGTMIAREARALGFNLLLAGDVNLARDPRAGRNFEAAGEDPLLAGRIVGTMVAAVQDQHVLSTIKHFAVNDFETARMLASSQIAEDAMRESDLLAFEYAIEIGHPGAIMASYNRVNDTYTAENTHLLTDILKHDWHYPGFVMGDWGGTHSTARAALAGLDQESAGTAYDSRHFFGAPLARAVADGTVPAARVNDMAHRILRAMFDAGLFDHPVQRAPLDIQADRAIARDAEEKGIVLLRNENGVLPLRPGQRIAVIGGHADIGVLAGGGSSNVIPVGGNVAPDPGPKVWYGPKTYDPDAPLAWLRTLEAPRGSTVTFTPGTDIATAAQAAGTSDVAIVFVTQWSHEGMDSPNLTLPDDQDRLIEAVARANPRTIVVLENNVPPAMPWLNTVAGVVEAWYPGSGGGEAIARVLDGAVNPSGRLPLTFPVNEAQLPRPEIPGAGLDDAVAIQLKQDQNVFYDEGADVGYRWFERASLTPQFPFGFGLSYSEFRVSAPTAHGLRLGAHVANLSDRAGATVVQFYATPPGGVARLVGWQRVELAAHAQADVTATMDPRSVARFDVAHHAWQVPGGTYRYSVFQSTRDQAVSTTAPLSARRIAP